MLNISHISKSFNPGTPNEKLVLNDLSLNVEKGDFITPTARANPPCSTPLPAAS